MTETEQTTVLSVADQGAATRSASDDAAQGGSAPMAGRQAFLFALRRDGFPVVPKPLTVAVAAIEGAADLERAVMAAPAVGLAAFCQGVANDVLAGKGYPSDFAAAAFEAQQAADRLNAQSIAVQEVRRRLHETFPSVVGAALPGLLGGLRKQVKETLAELREVDEVLGDLDLTDPAAIAAATDEQRAAFLKFNGLGVTYRVGRYAQRSALEASNATPPGWNDLEPWTGWSRVFEVGLHEFSDPREHGAPPPGSLGSPLRFRSLAARSDVWVPDVDQLADAWDRFNEPRPRPVESAETTTTTTGSAA